MELGHDDLGGRHAFALVDVGRNAAAVVAHGAGTVGIERYRDFLGEARQRLVDRVIDDFVDHVMQARAVVGVADIHARPLAHGIEPLEHLDQFRIVIGRCAGVALRTGSAMRGSSRNRLQKNACETMILVHENDVAYRSKWSQVRYCQIAVFQGFDRCRIEPRFGPETASSDNNLEAPNLSPRPAQPRGQNPARRDCRSAEDFRRCWSPG